MPLSANFRASLFMIVSMAGFTMNDALTKLVSTSMNFGQVMLVRGIFATLLVALLAWHRGALRPWRFMADPWVALRIIGEAGGTVTFLTALAHMPLANITAIMQALPLAVTMGAALFFAEPVGWRRWTAILVGFAGVMIIVRPGFEGFNAYAGLVLVTVLFAALRDLATRQIPDKVPSLFVSLATSSTITLLGACLVQPFGGWSPLTPGSIALLALAAVLVVVGYQFVIMAMREGDISTVAPFRYTGLLWAIVLGYLLFGDFPDAAMIAGSVIVVASGLYTLYRERAAGRTQPAAESVGPAMATDGV